MNNAEPVNDTQSVMLSRAIEDTVQATQTSLGMHPHCAAASDAMGCTEIAQESVQPDPTQAEWAAST